MSLELITFNPPTSRSPSNSPVRETTETTRGSPVRGPTTDTPSGSPSKQPLVKKTSQYSFKTKTPIFSTLEPRQPAVDEEDPASPLLDEQQKQDLAHLRAVEIVPDGPVDMAGHILKEVWETVTPSKGFKRYWLPSIAFVLILLFGLWLGLTRHGHSRAGSWFGLLFKVAVNMVVTHVYVGIVSACTETVSVTTSSSSYG